MRRSTTCSHTTSEGARKPDHAGDRGAPAAPEEHPLAALLAALPAPRRRQVLTHRSWADERAGSYERLELLGDSVLQLVITSELMRRHPEAPEGDLAWMRQAIVNERACADVARAARLPEAMVAQAPAAARDAAASLAARPSVQSDVVEAVIGSAWLELGVETTQAAVTAAFRRLLEAAVPGQRDPKTALQEEAARRRLEVAYDLVASEGPPHERTFESRAVVGGQTMGTGRGRSKQASERAAAAEALARLAGAA